MVVIFGVNVLTNKDIFVPNGRAGEMNFGILKEEKEEGTIINLPVFYGTRDQRGQGANEKE